MSDSFKSYYEWLLEKVSKNRTSNSISYNLLFRSLYTMEFTCLFDQDKNRISDALKLRGDYTEHGVCIPYRRNGKTSFLHRPCSVLEVMIALAIRMEDTIMTNPAFGNRTAQWFWMMVASLGLNGMYDDNFDSDYVNGILENFLLRKYEPNGRGGLFTIKNTDKDLRKVEIWVQMLWFLDTLV